MAKILLIPHAEVERLLPMPRCIEVMEGALRALAEGKAVQPLRSAMRLPDGAGLLGMMPAYLEEPVALGAKIVSVFPGNSKTRYDSHQGVVLLFEAEHGRLLAILDGSSITAIRTAAVSAVATRLLAREDATDLALLGSGVQARTHLEAMLAVRPIERVFVHSPNRENRERFAERQSERFGLPVEAVDSGKEAVEHAHVVCAVTNSPDPVLSGDWLAPGTHVNAVGACTPNARELDTEAVVRSRLFVDRIESAVHEAGDFRFPKAEGRLKEDHILGEIGEIILGRKKGRTRADEITLFKSLGVGVEDMAAAHHIYHRAVKEKTGHWLEMGP